MLTAKLDLTADQQKKRLDELESENHHGQHTN